MRFITHSRFVQFCALALMLAVNLISAQSQTTAFSYQGKLDEGGVPANGPYDFQFKLFDAIGSGSQIGSTVSVDDLAVTAGIFITTLDFGAAAFPGANRWLEISVRAGASTGAYTALSPRQQISTTPYSVKSLNATAADSLSSACAGCVHSTQIDSISSTQLNDLIHGSALELPLNFSGGYSLPIILASNTGGGTGIFGGSTTATGSGVYGQNSNNGGIAIYGVATSLTGATISIHGVNNSADGTGIKGSAASTTGFNFGVTGQTASPDGTGVFGNATSATGLNIGAGGLSNSTSGTGVYGNAISTTGTNYGVEGHSRSNAGTGVFGRAQSSTGTTYGVYGISNSASGTGVYGTATANGGLATNPTSGVWGAVNGTLRVGVRASNSAIGGTADGLLTTTASPSGFGIYAINSATSGVRTAGFFDGNVQIAGNLTKSSGTFKIDHPLDPENKYLYHSFVESPDMMNIYNGNVTTDAEGQAVVTLPGWFEALNRDFRYQLTVIGTFAQAIVAEEITGNSFKIITSAPNVKVSWQVTGVRQDAFANKHRIQVEEDKPETERGFYLHPDAFNQPEEKGVNWARNPGLMQELKESRERSLRGEPEPKPVLPTARRGNQ